MLTRTLTFRNKPESVLQSLYTYLKSKYIIGHMDHTFSKSTRRFKVIKFTIIY